MEARGRQRTTPPAYLATAPGYPCPRDGMNARARTHPSVYEQHACTDTHAFVYARTRALIPCRYKSTGICIPGRSSYRLLIMNLHAYR